MQEHTEPEELLNEDLLEWVTVGNMRIMSNHPGSGSFLDCAQCQTAARVYDTHINLRDVNYLMVDFALQEGNNAEADKSLEASSRQHYKAQQAYDKMAAHEHPDFSTGLRQQRLHYNPPN